MKVRDLVKLMDDGEKVVIMNKVGKTLSYMQGNCDVSRGNLFYMDERVDNEVMNSNIMGVEINYRYCYYECDDPAIGIITDLN